MDKNSKLCIGIKYRGFLTKKDITLINVKGKLKINGTVSINRGARIDVCPGGILELNDGVEINSFTKIICKESIFIGEKTAIGWDSQILDTDFHLIEYSGRVSELSSPIFIGNNVWISCKVSIYKGVKIADRSVISANAILFSNFKVEKENSFVALKNLLIAIPNYVKNWGG